jgi:hypothetical protein
MRLLFLIPLLALAACNGPAEQACTMIGCNDGLRVDLDGFAPDEAFTARALVDGAVVATAECAQGGCADVWLDGVAAPNVTIEIATESGQTWSATFAPEYAEVQPNGPGCPPVCLQAAVQMPAP